MRERSPGARGRTGAEDAPRLLRPLAVQALSRTDVAAGVMPTGERMVRVRKPSGVLNAMDLKRISRVAVRRVCTASCIAVLAGVALSGLCRAEDWPQFRGPGARGIAGSVVPLAWSQTENLRWKTPLPGPGSSSPIVHGKHVFVTSYSGVAGNGTPGQLVRHLLCIERAKGNIRWQKQIALEGPEDSYQGYLTEHGYASNTPVTDGEKVFAFFGKSGVFAFDMEGKELWRTGVGKESSNRHWGSAASLILHGDLVICNASEESQSIRALDKQTGREVWKAEGAGLELAYGTPGIVTLAAGKQELVIALPEEVWGLDPATGKLLWHATTALTGNVSPSVIVDGETIYAFGGRGGGSVALKAGGRGDVTKSHVLWTSRVTSYVATPLLHEGHLYWIDDRGQAFCSSAATGAEVYRQRVAEITSGGRPVYASPILVDGRLLVVTRWNGTLVLPAAPRYEILRQNRFEGDESDSSGTPAVSNGEMFIRSGEFLYCVAAGTGGK